MPRHVNANVRTLVAAVAATISLGVLPSSAGATLHLVAPASAVNAGDLEGGPDGAVLFTVRGQRDPGDPTTISITLLAMIARGGAGGLTNAYQVRTLSVPDAARTFSARITRGDLRTAGQCSDAACTATTPADAWQPDPYVVVAHGPGGVAMATAPGGVGLLRFGDSTDPATASARIGDGRGGFAELNASPAGGGPNFLASLRPLPALGAGGMLGAWTLDDVRVDGAVALQPPGAGAGFRQTHVVGRDGRVGIVQRYRLRRPAADGVALVRGYRFLRDGGGTVHIDDAFTNPSARRVTVTATYVVRAVDTDAAVWRIPWLGRAEQHSRYRLALPRPPAASFVVVHREAAPDGEANRGWAAFVDRPASIRFETSAFAEGRLRVTFRFTLAARATRHLRLGTGATQDSATAVARAGAFLAARR